MADLNDLRDSQLFPALFYADKSADQIGSTIVATLFNHLQHISGNGFKGMSQGLRLFGSAVGVEEMNPLIRPALEGSLVILVHSQHDRDDNGGQWLCISLNHVKGTLARDCVEQTIGYLLNPAAHSFDGLNREGLRDKVAKPLVVGIVQKQHRRNKLFVDSQNH